MKRILAAVACALLLFPASGLAQESSHAVSAATLDELLVSHAADAEAQRSELTAFLARPEVREIARDAGVDVVAAEAAVAALDAEDLQLLSTQLTAAEAALAGGDTVVISTTAIIIALLVIIIILVA